MLSRRQTVAGLALAATGGVPTTASAAPRARLIDNRWQRTGRGDGPDHGAWDRILGRHLSTGADGIARFDYRSASRAEVRQYLTLLSANDPVSMRSGAAFAFWVNLYNALTVDTVLGAFPVTSIRRIGGNPLSPGPWRRKLVEVSGRALSLDDIEHGILRPVWQDPRVHYAVNCAALGCPNLAGRAYREDRLEEMLTAGARAFVNHPRGARLSGGQLQVSSIYTWFQADFGGSDAGVIAHLRAFAGPDLARSLEGITRVADHSYDWRLNSA